MKHQLRSATSTGGRRMAGARALWRANGMKETEMGNPIIAIVNSFTQFVPGHVHLHEIGQTVKKEIEKSGCFAAEFNTIAIDDGIAMGHDGMLYSLPSRDLIADSVEYMVNAHKADAMICISNCDKITPGMLMAAMRLNIPTIFVSGGPMEAGQLDGKGLDLIDAMVESADETISDDQVRRVEHAACPTCGSCSGMFTANSMNCLNEAIGLALPGNGTVVATHRNRERLFIQAARQIVENCRAYYQDGDESVLPRNIATRAAFLNAMTLDIAMGGSTNTVLHLLAIAQEAGVDFTIQDIDTLSRKSPVLCSTQFALPHTRREPCGRYSLDSRHTRKRGADRRICPSSRSTVLNRSHRTVCDTKRNMSPRSGKALEKRTGQPVQPRDGLSGKLLRQARYRPFERVYPRFRTRLCQRRWTGRTFR